MKHLTDAVNSRNCSVRILILNPAEKQTIERRAKSISAIGFDQKIISTGIEENAKLLDAAWKEIHPDKKDKFKCRYYEEWIAYSIYGFGENYQIGHYLLNKLSTDSHYIKIAGNDKSMAQEIRDQFDAVWKISSEHASNDLFHKKAGK